jgi:hypothetical protein
MEQIDHPFNLRVLGNSYRHKEFLGMFGLRSLCRISWFFII